MMDDILGPLFRAILTGLLRPLAQFIPEPILYGLGLLFALWCVVLVIGEIRKAWTRKAPQEVLPPQRSLDAHGRHQASRES
jgi:hypothetical protein